MVHEPGDAGGELLEAGEAVPVVEFVLEDRPERFGARMIEAGPGLSHGTH